MRKLFLFSAGALALAGCDFAGGSDAAATAPIASLQAANVPAAGWDTDGSAADTFFEIQDPSGRSLYRSEIDAAGGTTAAVPAGVAIPSSTIGLRVALYDFDESLRTSTLMARSAMFTAAQVSAASSDSTQFAAESGTASFTVVRR